jgi:endo-1,4-beta-xylanase
MEVAMNLTSKKAMVLLLQLLVITGLFVMLAGPQSMNVQAVQNGVPTGQRLRALAGSFYIGFASANNFWTFSDAAQYQETARTEFNILTPENAMKWDAIHPQQNTYSFTQADQHVQFAQQNNMAVHGHTLVWHSQNPPWLTNGSWTSTTLTNVLYDHIDTVMGHYQGDILVWDVVNEAFDDSANPRNSIWRNVIGPNYIDLAFQRARAADSGAKLIYNDYNIETINGKSTAVYNMVASMKSRGIPIDGVGFQMHLTSGGINYQSLADNMQRFAQLGLEIYITEMDVRYPAPISQVNLMAQASIYGNVLDRCLAQTACKALQTWGFTDKYSWVPDFEPGSGDALIFDANYNAKPAYYALQAELGGGQTPTPTNTVTRTNTPTFTATQPGSNNTGWVSPSNQASQSGGDGNGFESAVTGAFADGGTIASDNNSGTGTSTSCTSTSKDRHAYFNYPISIPSGSMITGIEVRTDARVDSTSNAPHFCVQLSWNNGTSWTTMKTGPNLVTTERTDIFGSASDIWGRTWNTSELTSTNFRVRIVSVASSTSRDFFLDWVPVRVFYTGGGVTNTPTATATRTNTPTITPTGITNTPTRTNTPTITPTGGTSTLKLQYRAADTNAGDNQIKPHFNIVNLGGSSVPLSELKIRYWFTREGTQAQNFWCDYSAITGSCSNVTGTFVQLNPARSGADFYLEVGFTAGAGSIAAGGQSGEIQTRFSKSDWSNYIETGDYSFDPTKLSFADWTRITLYRNGVLVWGVEP